jgi:hypothetical protein
VLAPLLELDPELRLPDGTRLAACLAQLGSGQRAERVSSLQELAASEEPAARAGEPGEGSHSGGSVGGA